MQIKEYLEKNINVNCSKKFLFSDFINYYKSNKLCGEDLTILEYSENYYIVQCHSISKAQIILENDGKKISDEQIFFIKSIVSEGNLINPRKLDQRFITFLFNEFKPRVFSFFIYISLFIIIAFFSNESLLEISKKILETSISILGVYLSVMIVFINTDGFKYNKELFESGKLSYYGNTDKNLAKLVLYSILYLFWLYIILYLFGNINSSYIGCFRYIGFGMVGFGFYLIYLNFINLIDFYITKFTYLRLGEYKNNYFEDNFVNKKNK